MAKEKKGIDNISERYSSLVSIELKKLKVKDSKFYDTFKITTSKILNSVDEFSISSQYRVVDLLESKVKELGPIEDVKVYKTSIALVKKYLKAREKYSNDGNMSQAVTSPLKYLKQKIGLENTDKIVSKKSGSKLLGSFKEKHLGIPKDEKINTVQNRKKLARKGMVGGLHALGAATESPLLNLAAGQLGEHFNRKNATDIEENEATKNIEKSTFGAKKPKVKKSSIGSSTNDITASDSGLTKPEDPAVQVLIDIKNILSQQLTEQKDAALKDSSKRIAQKKTKLIPTNTNLQNKPTSDRGGIIGGLADSAMSTVAQKGAGLLSKIPIVGGLLSEIAGKTAAKAAGDQTVYVTNADEIGEAAGGGGKLGKLSKLAGKGALVGAAAYSGYKLGGLINDKLLTDKNGQSKLFNADDSGSKGEIAKRKKFNEEFNAKRVAEGKTALNFDEKGNVLKTPVNAPAPSFNGPKDKPKAKATTEVIIKEDKSKQTAKQLSLMENKNKDDSVLQREIENLAAFKTENAVTQAPIQQAGVVDKIKRKFGIDTGAETAPIGQKSQENLTAVAEELKKRGMSPEMINASLANIQKESGGITKSENLNYANTSNERIRSVFKSSTTGKTDEEVTAMKKDPKSMGEAMYGNKTKIGQSMGNTEEGDGFKYRGRGLIQITGKNNYSEASKAIFADDRLVKDPELANDPAIAAKISAWFIDKGRKSAANKLGIDPNTKDQGEANLLATQTIGGNGLNLNAGYGTELVGKVDKFSQSPELKRIAGITTGQATPTNKVTGGSNPQQIATAAKQEYKAGDNTGLPDAKTKGKDKAASVNSTVVNNTTTGQSGNNPSSPIYTGDQKNFPAQLARRYS